MGVIKATAENQGGASIVALGAFNPAIFQPEWLVRTQLIRAEEGDSANIEIVHPQVTAFQTEWFTLQVTGERLAISTRDPTKLLPLRDLVAGAFEILEQTPIRAFGYNRDTVYQESDVAELDAILRRLASHDLWGDRISDARLRRLTFVGDRPDCVADRVEVRLECVERALVVHINQHYQLDKAEAPRDVQMAHFQDRLKCDWDSFLSYAESFSDELISRVTKAE